MISGRRFGTAKRATAVAALGCGLAWGQGTTLMVPQGPLLPAKFGEWTIAGAGQGSEATSKPSGLLVAKTAEVLKEDGLVRSSEASYTGAGRPGEIKLEAFQFGDATGAASALTYLRTPEMKAVAPGLRVGREEAAAGRKYLFREGASVVLAEVSSPGGSTVEDLRALAVTLPKISGPKGLPPLLPTLLPSEGVVPGSMHYALGPVGYTAMGGVLPAGILGWDKSAEAATAEIAGVKGKETLTLLLLPTPEIAGDRGRAIEAALHTGVAGSTAALRREGPMLVAATGGFDAAAAKALVEGVHLRSEVTWNKQMAPEFHTEVRKTASLLVSIAVLSGVLMLAAVLLGLFLGVGRASIRVLMGKPAATEPEFLRLDLSGRTADGAIERKPAGV